MIYTRSSLGALLVALLAVGCEDDGGTVRDTWHETDAPPDSMDATGDTVDVPTDEGDVSTDEGDVSADEGDVPTDGPLDDSEWLRLTTTGARMMNYDFNQVDNYISCVVMSGDTLNISASNMAGGDQRFNMTYTGYSGPGTYDFTYSSSDPDFKSVEVRDGDYYYRYFYDFSHIDFHEEYSHCLLVVSEDPTGPAGYITGSLDCEQLWAGRTSPDYEEDPVEFRVTVDLSMTYRCETI